MVPWLQPQLGSRREAYGLNMGSANGEPRAGCIISICESIGSTRGRCSKSESAPAVVVEA